MMAVQFAADIQNGVDEKLSGLKLEEETSEMFEGVTCVFTVVPDPLIGLEATEHTAFNLIFIAEDSQQGLNAKSFVASLRMVGADVPVVLLKDGRESEEMAAQVPQFDEASVDHSGGASKFTATLRKPFTKRDLCDVIRSTLFPQFHRISGDMNSLTSDEDYRLGEDELSG
jgi:hypothetical protein